MKNSNPTSSTPTIPSKQIGLSDASKNNPLCDFLKFLEDDIASHPERLIVLDWSLVASVNALVGGIEVDINEPLSADDE